MGGEKEIKGGGDKNGWTADWAGACRAWVDGGDLAAGARNTSRKVLQHNRI